MRLGMLTPSSNTVLEPLTAAMLADARLDAICWNGTSGAWLGLEVDRVLCEAVAARIAGIPATTATLARMRRSAAPVHGATAW